MSWEVRGSHPHDHVDPNLYFLPDETTWFSLHIFHGGEFVTFPLRSYVNGKDNFIDFIDGAGFSLYDVGQMIRSLGIPDDEILFFHYKNPAMDLDTGLKPLVSQEDVNQLLIEAESVKVIELYVEHGTSHLQDVVIDCSGPPVSQDHASHDGENLQQHEHEHITEGDDTDKSEEDDSDDEDFHVKDFEESGDSEVDEEHESDDTDNSDETFIEEARFVDDVEVDMAEYRFIVENEEVPNVQNEYDDSDFDMHCPDESLEIYSEGEDDAPIKSVLNQIGRKKRVKRMDCFQCPFYLGQTIVHKEELRSSVQRYALSTRRQLHILKNDKTRFRVVCFGKNPDCRGIEVDMNKSKSGGTHNMESSKVAGSSIKRPTCPWVLHCSRGNESELFVVKTLVDEHHCLQTREVNLYTISFISREIEPLILSNPTIPLRALQDQIQKKHQINITLNKVFRAKMKAVKKLEGDFCEQYSILRDYCDELRRSNPGTTIKLDVERDGNPSSHTRWFRRIYICLAPLREGFKKCGRDILGLDGCFMKGPYPGQILTAVGVDANNGIYPVAYGLVEAETFNSWSWFLETLGEDLDISPNSNFTFITDRQKGLLPAIAKLFPSATHRLCLRHIHENMKIKWRGHQFKELLWKAASATTVPQFQKAMDVIKKKDSALHTCLARIPAKSWTKSHFSGRPKCDVLLNNWCEVFNRQLIGGRDKPIITCLEYIKEYLMKRIVAVHNKISKTQGTLTPSVTNQLNAIKNEASQYNVIMAGWNKYQATGPWLDQCVVDMNTKTCSCRRWELTGIPCKHAVAVIWNTAVNGMDVGIPEQWVSEIYNLNKWKEVYMHTIEPINGVEMWIPSDCRITLRPPKYKVQIGRPKKKRRKSQDELMANVAKDGKLTRKGHVKHCTKCKKPGHNARTCKSQGGQQSSQNT